MRSSSVIVFTLAAITILAGAAAAQQEDAKNFEFKQCNEDVLAFSVDPDPLKEVVEPDFALLLEEGKARVAIVAVEGDHGGGAGAMTKLVAACRHVIR